MSAPDPHVLEALLAEFAERREGGEALEPEAFLAAHPEGGAALRTGLVDLARAEALFPEAMPRLPERVGPYRVLGELGRGGMGSVLRVEHDSHPGEPRALKLLRGELQSQVRAQRRFRREAAALQRVRHPGVVRVLDVGADAERSYLVMELIEGDSLAARLQRNRDEDAHFSAEQCAALVAALARAVQALHDAGVLHRDLNPRNVLLRADDTPVLIDFGLVHAEESVSLTGSGDLLGTPQYMAPEQARGEQVDARADVYGLGAMLYELLGHRPPRSRGDVLDVLRAAAARPLPPLRSTSRPAPRALRCVVAKATAFRARRRYARAADLADELDAFLAGEPLVTGAPGLAQRLDDAWLRHRRGWAALAAVLLVGVSAWSLSRPPPRELDTQLRELHHRAAVLWLDGRLPELADVADQLVALRPDDPLVGHLRASAAGRLLEAPDPAWLEALVASERARRAGDAASALTHAERAFNIAAHVPEVVAATALSAKLAGADERARELFENAAPFLGESVVLHLSLAELYLRAELYDDVLKAAHTAALLAPDDPRPQQLIARAHAAQAQSADG